MRRRDILAYAAVIGTTGGVSGCVSTPAQPPLHFDNLPPIRLAIGSFVTEEKMQAVPMDFIDRRRSDDLVGTTREYLSVRYVAAGGQDTGVGIIEEATLIERPRPAAGLLAKINPAGQGRDLTGSLAVRIVIRDSANVEKAFARARLAMSRPVPPATSVLERDRLAKALAHDLVLAIDQALSRSVRENLASYIMTS